MNEQTVEGRRRYSAKEKVAILREHLVEKVPVSTLCDKHQLNVNLFYRWQKEFFENGAAAFERSGDSQTRQLTARVQFLEGRLSRKDEVIAELMEDHVRFKKSLGQG